MVLLCSVTIIADRPRGYPPSAGTTCVATVRAYSRTDTVPKEIDLEEDDDLVGVDCVDIASTTFELSVLSLSMLLCVSLIVDRKGSEPF